MHLFIIPLFLKVLAHLGHSPFRHSTVYSYFFTLRRHFPVLMLCLWHCT